MDRTLHIALLAIMLSAIGALISWAPKVYAKWQPADGIETVAHRVVGWLGRHFWYIWAAIFLSMAIAGGLELNGLAG